MPSHGPSVALAVTAAGAAKGRQALVDEVAALRAHVLAVEEALGQRVSQVHPCHEASARNLVHAVAVRQRDTRALDEELALFGLAPPRRAESHVLANLSAVLDILARACGQHEGLAHPRRHALTQAESRQRLENHTEALFGPLPEGRAVRILVTLPSEAAGDPGLVRALVAAGMDCARINCAHDGTDEWAAMVRHVRAASREVGRSCRVLMDLAGPKLRTGPIAPGPRVSKCRPARDAMGRVHAPVRLWMYAAEAPTEPPAPGPTLPVSGAWLESLSVGDEVVFVDARRKRRRMLVVAREGGGFWATLDATAYFVPGTVLFRAPQGAAAGTSTLGGRVGMLPPAEQAIDLYPDDLLVLTSDGRPGEPAVRSADGAVVTAAHISCTLPEVFGDLRVGERVWLDDGKTGGVVEAADPENVRVRITRAKADGTKLRADKGINLPDSNLRVRGLTPDDATVLPFVVDHADMVALSFVRTPDDVHDLQRELRRLGHGNLGVILKIETGQALENLPALLLAAMETHPVGVMIARGDLAVECGFERLAEAQEEVLRVCDAAHLPVIWATQVLESLTKLGQPSRAEVTDVAMSARAECVMLNKGPFVCDAVRMLDEILCRMQDGGRGGGAIATRWDVAALLQEGVNR